MANMWEDFLVVDKKFDSLKNMILLLGLPGSGKTTFVGTCPKPVIVNTDGGTLTLAGKNIPEVVFNKDNTKDIMKNMLSIVAAAKAKEGIFATTETFVIDSLSKLAKFYMDDIMKYQVRPARDPTKEKPTFDHWGMLKNNLENLLDELRGLANGGMHVVCTCGVRTELEEATGKYINIALMDGQIRYVIPYGFDEVLALEAKTFGKTTKYLCFSKNIDKYVGLKSRSDVAFEIENPTFGKVREALEAKKEGRE